MLPVFAFIRRSPRIVLMVALAVLLSTAGRLAHDASAARLAAIAPGLGTAASFAVLGASAVTNTGPSVLIGDLGISPNGASSITGFPPGIVDGSVHAADATALQAQTDTATAYNALASQSCDTTFAGPTDLGGMTLVPGVYCFGSSAGLTGLLTLNAQGNPAAVWVFRVGSALTTAPGSTMAIINGGTPCNVFFQIGSSATLDTNTTFLGNILALQSVSMNNGASVAGRVLARNGAVTLINNNISNAGCPGAPTPAVFDLSITKTASPSPVTVGSHLTFQLAAMNSGTITATNVTVTDTLPAGVNFVSATPSQGICNQAAGVVICNLGTLLPFARATINVVVMTTVPGTLVNGACVADDLPEENLANNCATVTVPVLAPPAQVPEGDTLVLVATGLAGLAGYAGLRRRARRARTG